MEEKEVYLEVELSSSKDKGYYYCLNSLNKGDYVVVDTGFGTEVAYVSKVLTNKKEIENRDFSPITRVANKQDIQAYFSNKESELEAGKIFNDNVKKLNLSMKLVDVVYTLDKSKILFTYVSEERVDFRELLKELSGVLKCRIELRQIGPRDRSKSVGGIGICGLPLCCKSFLNEFEGISINMAKNQFLALNIQKLSGQCGKLLCCLKYEDESYTELKKDAPRIGFRFHHEDKDYKITSINVLTKTAKIESMDKEVIKIVSFDEVNEMMKK